MDLKIFLSVFIVLVNIQSIYSQSITCNYVETVNGYTCIATIDNPNGVNNFPSIGGQHLANKGDTDVRAIISSGPTSTNVPSIFCNTFVNTETIYFLLFNIQTIDFFSFNGCTNLVTLDLHTNQIAVLNELAFIQNVNLTRIDLHQNRLTNLPNLMFWMQSYLTYLNLEGNLLSTLNSTLFSTLTSLRYLYMQNNQIEVLPIGMFENLSRLIHIDLNNNKLKVISADSFGILPTLSVVSMQNNQIEAIDERFMDKTGVTNFDLKENICVDANIIDSTELKQMMRSELRQCFNNYVNLNDHNNTIDCIYMQTEFGYTCRASIYNPNGLNNFTSISGVHSPGFDDSKVTAIIGMTITTSNVPKIFCDKFSNVETIFYIQLGITNLGQDSFWSCEKLLDLNIWSNRIQDIDYFTFLYSPQLRRLDMRQNSISNMSRILLWPLSELKALNLEQNDLTFLHPDWFLRHWNLTHLNLQYNKIDELPKAVFGNMTSLEHLVLNNNKLKVIHSNSFGGHPMLTNASFVNNQINAIDERFIDNTGLTNIDMRGNVCANSNIIDNSPNRGLMRSSLRDCFQNYEDLYGESTTSSTTTTQPTTTTSQCPVGNLDARVCQLEIENQDLLRRIEALESRKDEF